jgi:asparagine synthase (glutamine-hydrolysing)
LLFAQPEPSAVTCLTFCDRENLEVARARAVAQVAGAPHHILYRDPEHYGLGAEATVRITGGMGSIKDAHFHGFASDLQAHEHSSLVTGCYADYLLKGLALNRQPYTLLGRELPIDRLAPYNADFYQPRFKLAAAWQGQVEGRQRAYFGADAAARYAQSPASIEDLRVRPLVREADSIGRIYLLATQRWDPILVDRDLLAFYGRLPPALKINSQAFARAVLRLLPAEAHRIPNNNAGQCALGWPLWRQWLAGVQELAGSAVRRRVQWPAAELATWCSWPDFSYYTVHSRVLGELWSELAPGHPEIFEPMLGYAPQSRSRSDWARDTSLFLRLLTLKLWLRQRGY